jgi:calcineurin-like phosphoesterase family protein
MNSHLIANINEVVEQDDVLFHLGDWSFGGFESIQEFRDSIFCKNVHIITGNHDHRIESNKENCQSLFSSVNKYLDLTVKWNLNTPFMGEQKFALMHFPIASWNDMARGAIHLHGHVHFPSNKRIGKGKMMDVGVDGNDLYPIALSEVLRLMNIQPIKSMFEFDHHEVVENYKK